MGSTILLADKSVTIQKIVELTFADENFTIRSVNDGNEALALIPQLRPSIILADISLPGKTGYDICNAVRTDPAYADLASTPVILLAGIYETMDEDRARQVEERVKEVRANDFLSKPFDPQLLTAKVKELVGTTVAEPEPAQPQQQQPAVGAAAGAADNIFSSWASVGDDNGEKAVPVQPPDEERTMMLPGPIFSNNMFAEASPFESSDDAKAQQTPAIESASPLGEPVFDGSALEEEDATLEPQFPDSEYNTGSALADRDHFGGKFEQEFTGNASSFDSNPFGGDNAGGFGSGTPSVVGPSDDPFGDVFGDDSQASAAPSWSSQPVSEEEAPFGMPEPPPAPPALEPEPVMAAPDEPSMPSPSELWGEPSASSAAPAQPEFEPMIEPDFGEETWSRAQSAASSSEVSPVEELFDAEPEVAVEPEIEELQPDTNGGPAAAASDQSSRDQLMDSLMKTDPGIPAVHSQLAASHVPQPAAQASVSSTAAPAEITDELIDRVAERILARLSEKVVSDIVWQVVPDLAEKMIKRELEKLNAGGE